MVRFGRWFSFLLCMGMVMGFTWQPDRLLPNNKAAYRHYYKGLSFYGESQFGKAEAELGKAWRSWPENFNFTLAYSLALSRTGGSLEAQRMLSALRIKDTDPYLEHKQALLYFGKAMALHYGGEGDQAISALETGISWQKRTGQEEYLASFYTALGFVRIYNQGKGSNHNGLGVHYHVHRRDIEKASLDFERALGIDPEHTVAQENLFRLADTLGQEVNLAYQEVKSRGPRKKSSLFTGLPQDVDRVLDLAAFDEVVMLVDISGSMTEENVTCMSLSRFEVMRNLGLFLVDQLPEATQMGIGTIGGDCGDTAKTWSPVGALSRHDLRYEVRFLNAHGTTPMMERLRQAESLFSDNPGTTKGLFLISDGANVCPEGPESICSWAGSIQSKGITLNVLTFLDVSYNNVEAFAEYGCLADNTNGRIFFLNNVNCSFTDISYQWLSNLDFKLPKLEKVYCWGPNIESLWAIFPED